MEQKCQIEKQQLLNYKANKDYKTSNELLLRYLENEIKKKIKSFPKQ